MDKDLKFLKDADQELLGIFVESMLEKGKLTETLTSTDEYMTFGKNYHYYLEKIEEEFLLFGSNTLFSLVGKRNSYREVLIDVAEKLKVNFNESQSVELIENRLLEKVLEDAVNNMDEEQREELKRMAREAQKKYASIDINAELTLVLISIFRSGGFLSYQLALIIANTIAKMILGRGLTLATNATITRVLGVLTGPIGMALVTLWTLFDIAGPAYRVTVPCTILIAVMRKEVELRKYKNGDLNE